MDDIYDSFSCSDSDLSRTNITEDVWILGSNVSEHETSVLVQAIMQTLFVAIGVPWNTIVLIVILVEKLYKNPTYALLLNLVIADVLVYVCVLPFNIETSYAQEFAFGNSDYVRCSVCQSFVVVIVALVYVSLFTLALMSVDRLIYIKWPLRYNRHVTIGKVIISLILVWIFCFAVAILPVFGVGEIKFSRIISSCSIIARGDTGLIDNSAFILILVVIGLLPFVTIVVCNVWILVLIHKATYGRFNKKRELNNSVHVHQSLRRSTEKELRTNYQKQQLHLVKLFGALFIANFITWVPSIAIAIASVAIGSDNIPYFLSSIQYLAYVSQPVVHPMLETCLFNKARTTIINCLCFCCYRRKKNQRHSFPSTESILQSHLKSGHKSSVENLAVIKETAV